MGFVLHQLFACLLFAIFVIRGIAKPYDAAAISPYTIDGLMEQAISQFMNRSNWMAGYAGTAVENLPLRKLRIPGSHDTGTYGISGQAFDGFSITQNVGTYMQLFGGMRYLDLRVGKYNGQLRVGHGPIHYGELFRDLLQQVSIFVIQNRMEVLIVQIHYENGDFTNADKLQLHLDVQQLLGPVLIKSSDLWFDFGTVTLRQMWNAGKNIILFNDYRLFPDGPVQIDPQAWGYYPRWNSSYLYDDWPNSNAVGGLINWLTISANNIRGNPTFTGFWVTQMILTQQGLGDVSLLHLTNQLQDCDWPRTVFRAQSVGSLWLNIFLQDFVFGTDDATLRLSQFILVDQIINSNWEAAGLQDPYQLKSWSLNKHC